MGIYPPLLGLIGYSCFLNKAVQLAFSNIKSSALLSTNENNIFLKENALFSNIQSIFNMNTLIFLQKLLEFSPRCKVRCKVRYGYNIVLECQFPISLIVR